MTRRPCGSGFVGGRGAAIDAEVVRCSRVVKQELTLRCLMLPQQPPEHVSKTAGDLAGQGVEALFAAYCRDGYAIIEDAVPPDGLSAAQRAYEATIVAAIEENRPGASEFKSPSPTVGTYRFQDPHHPSVVQPDLVAAMSGPKLMAFVERLCGPQHCMHGIAAFSMGDDYDYQGQWHRDSYAAWGKDSDQELKVRTVPTAEQAGTQVLLALHDDACFTFIPGSQVFYQQAMQWSARCCAISLPWCVF